MVRYFSGGTFGTFEYARHDLLCGGQPFAIQCCGLVKFQGLMAERSPDRAIKVSAPTASPDWSGTSAQCPPRRCPARSVLCRTPAVRQDGEDCWVDRGRMTGPRSPLRYRESLRRPYAADLQKARHRPIPYTRPVSRLAESRIA